MLFQYSYEHVLAGTKTQMRHRMGRPVRTYQENLCRPAGAREARGGTDPSDGRRLCIPGRVSRPVVKEVWDGRP